MSDPQNQDDIKKWMEDTARNITPKKKLVFDRTTKKLVAVPVSDPRADQNLQFTPEEAKRFAS